MTVCMLSKGKGRCLIETKLSIRLPSGCTSKFRGIQQMTNVHERGNNSVKNS